MQFTQKAGYASATLADFLTRLDDRNKDQPERNGLFASHPETKERIDKIRQAAGAKRGANGEARYKRHIKYTAVPMTAIAAVEAGSAGLTGSKAPAAGKDDKGKEKDKKAEEPKKKGVRDWQPEADGRTGETDGTGVGVGRIPGSRSRSRGQGREQPVDREGRGADRRRGGRVQAGARVSGSRGSGRSGGWVR